MISMIAMKPKHHVVAALSRHETGPAGYSIALHEGSDFEEFLEIKLSGISHILSNQIIGATLNVDVITFDCGLLLFADLQNTFNVFKLSRYAASILGIIYDSGWTMIDLSWEPPIVVLIKDRWNGLYLNYWSFDHTDSRGLDLVNVSTHRPSRKAEE